MYFPPVLNSVQDACSVVHLFIQRGTDIFFQCKDSLFLLSHSPLQFEASDLTLPSAPIDWVHHILIDPSYIQRLNQQ